MAKFRNISNNLIVEELLNFPSNPKKGRFVIITTDNLLYYYNGTSWVAVGNVAWDKKGNANINPSNDFLGTTDNQPLVIRTNNTEKVRVLANGNVGIGTNSPGAKIDIQGTSNTVTARILNGGINLQDGFGFIGFHFSSTTPTSRYFSGIDSNGSNGNFSVRSNNGRLIFDFNQNFNCLWRATSWNTTTNQYDYTDRMNLSAQGNLGVGLGINASERLQVVGNGLFSGSVTAASYVTSSDERIKENIQPIESGLAVIMAIEPVSYALKKEYSTNNDKRFGFLAQNIEKTLPEIVQSGQIMSLEKANEMQEHLGEIDKKIQLAHSDDEKDFLLQEKQAIEKNIYHKVLQLHNANETLIAFLIKAVQEQQGEIENLKRQLSR